ncbi:unnamed protein product [Camellia sinensis]
MGMRKKIASTSSMKSLCLVLCVMVLLMGTHFSVVNCRALQAAMDALIAEQVDRPESTGVASFAFSSNNSSGSGFSIIRSLGFKLASGPSKRGPGH